MKRFLVVLLILLICLPTIALADLEAHFLDVGHGECTILISQGKAAIIDGGPLSARDVVNDYLAQLGIEKLEYIIITSPEDEHIGGLSVDEDSWNTIISPVWDHDSRNYRLLRSQHFGPMIKPLHGDFFELGDAIITFYTTGTAEDTQYIPVMVKASDGNISVLICGDADASIEEAMLSSGADLSADVLRISHHDGKTANTADFISAVSPSYVVVSCTEQNDAPPADVMIRYIRQSIPVLCTDYTGTIIINAATFSKEETVPVTCERWYIGNANSEIFHRHTCTSVGKMREYNKVPLYSPQEAAYLQLQPCKNCSP